MNDRSQVSSEPAGRRIMTSDEVRRALVRIGHPVLSVLLVLLAATQLMLTYVFHQR